MNIDRIEFISWMERIMDRFDMLKDSLTDIEKKKNKKKIKFLFF